MRNNLWRVGRGMLCESPVPAELETEACLGARVSNIEVSQGTRIKSRNKRFSAQKGLLGDRIESEQRRTMGGSRCGQE